MKEQMTTPLDISYLEKTWDDYLNDSSFNYIGKLNLAAWMGERMGLVLREIQILRTQVENLQLALQDERDMAAEAVTERQKIQEDNFDRNV